MTGAAAMVSREIATQLKAGLTAGSGNDSIWRRFIEAGQADNSRPINDKDFSPEDITLLLENGILAESFAVERSHLETSLKSLLHPSTLKLTLCYTAACQLRCAYCFQTGRDKSAHHRPELREQTLSWVENYLDQHHEVDTIHLGLLGGEPLSDVLQATFYIERLRALANRKELGFEISMTSNGVNLNSALMEDWSLKGLKYLRVTLDGPPDVHDSRRYFPSGRGSFHAILRNLIQVKDTGDFGIGISINLDAGNVEHVAELLDILDACGLKDEVEIILEPVLPAAGEAASSHQRLRAHLDEKRIGLLLRKALKQVVEQGFRTPVYPGLCMPCNFVQANNFIVSWSGQLFRCTFTMLQQNMAVGSVEDGVTGNNERLLAASKVTAFCLQRECAYLPLCGGGCRYWAWCRTGDFDSVNCQKEYWDQVLPLALTHAFGLRPVSVAE